MEYNQLIGVASATRLLAYVSCSGFQVGAALVAKAGKIYTDCNVENVSLGLTICAERSAIAQASKESVAIAVVTAGKKAAISCGACRQVLAEFNPNMKMLAATTDGKKQEFDLAELFPFPAQGILERSRDV
jgi:cytidine deaminase